MAELDDPVGHTVDEVPVVTDEQDGAPVGSQVLLQPANRVDVEVVGGLVEQQHVGGAQQEAGEDHPHAPATGQLPHRTAGVLGPEAEAAEDAFGLGLQGVAAELLEAGLHLAVLVEHAGVTLGQAAFQVLEALVQLGQRAAAVEGLVEHRALRVDRLVLGEVADAQVGRTVDLARVGSLQADHDLQQGGLAHAVGADERDAPTVAQDEGDVAEQGPHPVGLGQPRHGQHGGSGYGE